MIQTGIIPSAHSDLVTDASYDFYGLRLATCSLDQRIKIWQLNESNGSWSLEDDWKAHDAAVSKISWAHPEFGTIIASASFDRTVKVWEQASGFAAPEVAVNGSGGFGYASSSSSSLAQTPGPSTSRWVERAVLSEARGTVRAVEFSPHHFGLKLATISTDNQLRIYECLEQHSLANWPVAEEVDVAGLPTSPAITPYARTGAPGTPTQTAAAVDPTPPLLAQALQQSAAASSTSGISQPARPGIGNREADGGWCLSWCKDRYWGEVIAAGAGTSGTIKVIQLHPAHRPTTLLTLDPAPKAPSSAIQYTFPPTSATDISDSSPSNDDAAVTSVSWAPSCGRSYHLIATGSRDGHVRIWKVTPGDEEDDAAEDNTGLALARVDNDDEDKEKKWAAQMVADFDQHRSAVGRVEWNLTGTVLSSTGNDGRVRLWKATPGSVWRPAGSVGVEQSEEHENENGGSERRDTDMES
ncbi:unnamed protein product [Mycena citricolor]|uniref:WD40 repeat-like protein n=1 Tax=Mycena citricolor TaxID=2018698 RepID=A0AAD2K0H3_9AGAR|nr:unnamed protein product [Mycena citricolor]